MALRRLAGTGWYFNFATVQCDLEYPGPKGEAIQRQNADGWMFRREGARADASKARTTTDCLTRDEAEAFCAAAKSVQMEPAAFYNNRDDWKLVIVESVKTQIKGLSAAAGNLIYPGQNPQYLVECEWELRIPGGV